MTNTDNTPWTYERRTQTIVDKDGSYVAMIRGWGNLTGKGYAALGLSDEEAIKIQDDRGRRLAKVPEYEARIAKLEDLVECLLDNDPDEPISDGGHTVLDLWRHDATKLFQARAVKSQTPASLSPAKGGTPITEI